MAISNTNILIKRSETTSSPSALLAGEFAYSYLSNTLFLGNAAGNGVVNVGGVLYTQAIDNATDTATPSTLVERDVSGNASFNTVYGSLGSTFSTLTAGQYGSTTAIPVITVAANGQVTNVYTETISTTLGITSDSGSNTLSLITDTLDFNGGEGITTSIDTNTQTVNFNVDNTVLRSNTAIIVQTIDGSVSITGNLSVLGTEFITNTTTLNIADPLIYLASNNYTSDIVDIGFVGNYFDGVDQRHTGVARHAANKEFYIFDNLLGEPINTIDINDSSFRSANVHTGYLKSTGLISSNIESVGTDSLSFKINGFNSSLNNDGTATLAGKVTSAGLNLNDYSQAAFDKANSAVVSSTSLTSGQMVVGNGGNTITTVANTTYTLTGSLSASKTITSLTVDAYGRVTAATGTDIGIDANQITSGTITTGQGGTGQTSFTTGAIIVGNGSGALQTLANTTFTTTGSAAGNNTISSVTVDAYGRFTDVTYSAIVGLKVNQGGTGVAAFTTNGIVYGNGSGDMQVTAAAGTADISGSQQILTVTTSGVPIWSSSLDGGTF